MSCTLYGLNSVQNKLMDPLQVGCWLNLVVPGQNLSNFVYFNANRFFIFNVLEVQFAIWTF